MTHWLATRSERGEVSGVRSERSEWRTEREENGARGERSERKTETAEKAVNGESKGIRERVSNEIVQNDRTERKPQLTIP
jgi:hypothetical protein